MPVLDDVETGTTSIYDERGRTRIPNDIKESLGWEKGDELKLVAIDGELRVVKREKE